MEDKKRKIWFKHTIYTNVFIAKQERKTTIAALVSTSVMAIGGVHNYPPHYRVHVSFTLSQQGSSSEGLGPA
jgi:hypothetical protein